MKVSPSSITHCTVAELVHVNNRVHQLHTGEKQPYPVIYCSLGMRKASPL